MDNLLALKIFYFLMALTYNFVVFKFADTILEKRNANKLPYFLVIVTNAALWFILADEFINTSRISYILMFLMHMIEFKAIYKDKLSTALFVNLSCMVHIMTIRAFCISIFAISLKHSVYYIVHIKHLSMLAHGIAAMLLSIVYVLILRHISSKRLKIINQHTEQLNFILLWLSVFDIYLIANAGVYSYPMDHPLLNQNQLLMPVAILLGAYIVLMFSIKNTELLGYKEKSEMLTQAIREEQLYRNSVTSGAIEFFEYNITRNEAGMGFEAYNHIIGDCMGLDDVLNYFADKTIFNEDKKLFLDTLSRHKLFLAFFTGKKEVSVDYRLKTDDGGYTWARAIANLMQDNVTGDILCFVCIKDINDEKREQLRLLYRAERDALTGLYNKDVTGRLISDYLNLKDTKNGVVYIVDIDNFKTINDRFGHTFGDVVISELAERLRQIFKQEDIVGRIGGDEYMAFCKNMHDLAAIEEKANEIVKAFRNTFKDNKNCEYMVSGSVGIAIYPKHGTSFEQLYKAADTALYNAKKNMKNTYNIYNGESFAGYESNRTQIDTEVNVPIQTFQNNKLEYVFEMLYGSDNVFASISSVLKITTTHYRFSRGYIFEIDKTEDTASITAEWCADGISSQINKLRNIPIEFIDILFEAIDKKGVFVLENINQLEKGERDFLDSRNIRSMLNFGIIDLGKRFGIIGFDDCVSERTFNPVEIGELVAICSVISSYILKRRKEEIN